MEPLYMGLLAAVVAAIVITLFVLSRRASRARPQPPPKPRAAAEREPEEEVPAAAQAEEEGEAEEPGPGEEEEGGEAEEEEEKERKEREKREREKAERERAERAKAERAAAARAAAARAAAEKAAAEKAAAEKAAAEKAAEQERIRSIRKGLKATRGGFVKRLKALFGSRPELDASLIERIEEVFITADVGAKTAQKFIARMQEKLDRDAVHDPKRVWEFLRGEARAILTTQDTAPCAGQGPHTILVLGVNGVGKTTTIGKLAARYAGMGRKVILGAGDTFRAAATEQLEVWGVRVGCPVVKGKDGADPSSVIFDALKRAADEAYDVAILDTAGRLHTKVPLMEELKKVRRVMGKAIAGAPHETLLVMDATTGQNGLSQARSFLEALEVNGIVLTKLDGTAKGGVLLGIASELGIPVRYIGVGEGIEDLREFDPEEFVAALFDDIDEDEAAA